MDVNGRGTESPNRDNRELKLVDSWSDRELKLVPAGNRGERIFSILGNGREMKFLPAAEICRVEGK